MINDRRDGDGSGLISKAAGGACEYRQRSYNAVGINKVADCLETWYTALGWHVKAVDLGIETGRLLEISNRPGEHYDVMFVGHMDTVFLDGTAKERPFTIKGDNCYGPGVGDMKNGVTAIYHVAANLAGHVLRNLRIAMVSGIPYTAGVRTEITSSKETLPFVKTKEADEIKCLRGAL